MADEQLAQYSIIEKIGEGGMGEVFRAHDTRLGRDVALKFLPASLADDAERLGRFEREARVLAALNHPHIAAIHGFEHVDDKRFLVLELVDGEDLAQRLVRGPISVREALPIAQQIAEALEAAHEEGIVHRDLKPANILLTQTGNAKVLDFGLAKAWEGEPTDQNLTNSPTIMASSPTMAGVILGTAAYMSPEQARGHAVDKRADIYAFGAVLFEMLTAKQCFQGPTISDTLAMVLTTKPDYDALPKDTPKAIIKLLKRCLDKEVKTRLRDIGEARIVLDKVIKGEVEDEAPAAAAPVRTKNRTPMWIGSIAVAIILAAMIVRGMFASDPPPPPVTKTTILNADGARLSLRGIHPGPVAISKDGKRIVYAARTAGAQPVLYVRDLDNMITKEIRGTEGAGYPFWAPDGKAIGFFSNGQLKRVDLTGSPPLTLCDAPVGKGGSWSEAGVIVFAPTFTGSLYRVSESGGAVEEVTSLDAPGGENSHRFPRFLPDGNHFLYLARLGGEANLIRVGSLDGTVDKEVVGAASHGEYASGQILFVRGTTLMAQAFDTDKLEVSGDPQPVADPVRFISAAMRGVFSASENGNLVFQSGTSVPGMQLTWRGLDGEVLGVLGKPVLQSDVRISPDGKLAVVDAFPASAGTGDLWIYDIERDIRSRFTFDQAADENGVWSPDGKRIAFSSARDTRFGIYVKDVGGATNAELLHETKGLVVLTDWKHDHLVYFETDSMNTGNIMALALEGDMKPIPIVATQHGEYNGVISPDGHWMAYVSDESGAIEAYVTSFPDAKRKWQLSTNTGTEPHWDPNGNGLFFYGSDGYFHFVEARWDENNFAIGATREMFECPNEVWYDIHPDGDRFLVIEDADEGNIAPLSLVVGWDQELEAE